ncbi:unnamed protein product [Caenorhabditis brenneri]
MFVSVKRGNTVVLSGKKIPKKLPGFLSSANLVFLDSLNLKDLQGYDEVNMPLDEVDTDVFLDAISRQLFLTNFLFDEGLLCEPIEAIAVFFEKILMFVGTKVINFNHNQLPKKLQTERFYMETFQDLDSNQKKRKKRKLSSSFVDSTVLIPSASISNELGIVTYEHQSSSPTSSTKSSQMTVSSKSLDVFLDQEGIQEEVQEVQEEVEYGFESESNDEIYTVQPVKRRILDQKAARAKEVEHFKNKVIGILEQTAVKRKEIVVTTDDLVLSRDFSESDQTVFRMQKEISTTSNLFQSDPIVVVKEDDKYKVLSGNRRIAAFKIAETNKVWVTEIEQGDWNKYNVNFFFRNKANDWEDTATIMIILGSFLQLIDLPIATLKKWTTAEKNVVFGTIFSPESKMRLLLDIFVFDQLYRKIKIYLSSTGISLKHSTLRDVLRKYRQNPGSTEALLDGSLKTENELKTKLKNVEPDVRYLLEEKKIDTHTADDLVEIYREDPFFMKFIRSTDLRSIRKSSSQKKLIMEKFECYKEKQINEIANEDTTVILFSSSDSTFDAYLTSNYERGKEVSENQDNIFVFLIGVLIPEEPHYTLVVPDKLGIRDDFGSEYDSR